MEQLRIVREMREHGRTNGRPNQFIRPRYMVWENVAGATSSNEGRDFQTVLTEIVKIVKKESPDVPMPEGGKWSKSGFLYGMGDTGLPFSVAYRIHDAQYWGVPQRRQRIALVADFNGLSAGQIMFGSEYWGETDGAESDDSFGHPGTECRQEVSSFGESLPGNPESGGETWEETAGNSEECPGSADTEVGE